MILTSPEKDVCLFSGERGGMMRKTLRIMFASFVLATMIVGFLQLFTPDLSGSAPAGKLCPEPTIDCREAGGNCKSDGGGGSSACKCIWIWFNLVCNINE